MYNYILLNIMKRKKDSTDDNKRPKLRLIEINWLPCEICNTPVRDYKMCISPHVYCSLPCFEIIYLMYHGNFKEVSFHDDMEE